MGVNDPVADWHNVDWSKSTGEIADELGVSRMSVWKWRKRVAPETNAQRGRPDWDAVEWGVLPDAEVARSLGVCVNAVARQRRARGIEAVLAPRGEGYDYGAYPLGEMPDAEVAAMIGCTRESARQARIRRGIKRYQVRDVLASGDVDWCQTNKQIAAQVGCSANYVHLVRKRLGIPASYVLRSERRRKQRAEAACGSMAREDDV
jgi:hypothetical protein